MVDACSSYLLSAEIVPVLVQGREEGLEDREEAEFLDDLVATEDESQQPQVAGQLVVLQDDR